MEFEQRSNQEIVPFPSSDSCIPVHEGIFPANQYHHNYNKISLTIIIHNMRELTE